MPAKFMHSQASNSYSLHCIGVILSCSFYVTTIFDVIFIINIPPSGKYYPSFYSFTVLLQIIFYQRNMINIIFSITLFLQPLFPGESGVDQLVEIIKVVYPHDNFSPNNFAYVSEVKMIIVAFQILGTPTREEIKCMNPNYTEFKFPQIKAHPWHKVSLDTMPL